MNYHNRYDQPEGAAADPRYQMLCTMQIRELSEMTARHASERVGLAVAILKEERS